MLDSMMNEHTYATDNTTYTMLFVRSLCQIEWWMYKHVILIALLTSCFISDHDVRFNKEYTHMCYWKHYLHHVVYQINMSDIMMNVHKYASDNTT
jgi:hypothetical protein